MAGFSYHYDRNGKLELIEIPMGTAWRPLRRGRNRTVRWPVYVEVVHSSGGRIPRAYRQAGDLERSRRRHSRIMMWGNLLKRDSRPFTLILQDDDTSFFAQSVGCSISISEEEFGQMMLVHHEMAHVLLKHSQKNRRSGGSGQDVLEEGYCDAFSMALTLAMTKDVHAARKMSSVRSDYLAHRRKSARSAELKSLAPGGGGFTARCKAGDTFLASLNYILCGDAMDYAIRRWLEEPWDADINACSLVAMDWIKANSLTTEKASDIAVQTMSDIIAATGAKISFTIKAFMLSNLVRQERRSLKKKCGKSQRHTHLGWKASDKMQSMYQHVCEAPQ